jgi:hypothetical protein
LSAALTITAPQMASAALLSSCGPGIAVGAFTCPETVTFGSQKAETTNWILSLDKWLPLFPAPTDVTAPVGGTFRIDGDLVHHAGSPLPPTTMLAVPRRDASSTVLASPSAATPMLLPVSLDRAVFPSAATATVTLTSPVTLIAIPLDEFADLGPFEVSAHGSTTGRGGIEEMPNLAEMPLIMGIYGFVTERVSIAGLALASLLTALAGLGLVRWRRRLH